MVQKEKETVMEEGEGRDRASSESDSRATGQVPGSRSDLPCPLHPQLEVCAGSMYTQVSDALG